MAGTGVLSYISYGWETTYGTATTQFNKPFGAGVRVTELRRRNNVEKIFTIGARNAQTLQPKKFEGAKSIEFTLASPFWLRAVMGTVSSTGAGPATHTFSETDTIPSISIENDVKTDTASVAKLLGCKIANAVFTMAVGETVKVRLDVVYASETHGTTTAAAVSESEAPFTFANGTLELPSATTIAKVQNCEFTIANNPELIWGAGSRTAVDCPVKQREYTARVTLAMEGSVNLLQKLYGGTTGPVMSPAETATLNLTFDNGLTGTNQRQVKLACTGVQIDEHSLPQDPTAVLIEDATLFIRSVTPTAINNTATAP